MDVKAQSGETDSTVPELIRQYARDAGHFHAQDVNLRGPGMGDVDFEPIMKALVDSGYDRWVSVEVFDFLAGSRRNGPAEYRMPEAPACNGVRSMRDECSVALRDQAGQSITLLLEAIY